MINLCIDGQKIAKRVSSQISKETCKLQKLVTEYNLRTLQTSEEISLEMALDPETTLEGSSSVTPSQKHNLIQAYLRKKRGLEEIELLKTEMRQVLLYLQQKEDALSCSSVALTQSSDQFSHGACSILTNIKNQTRNIIDKTKREFTAIDRQEEADSDTSDTSDSDSDDNDVNMI